MSKDASIILIRTSAGVIHIGVSTDFIVKPISTIFFFSAFGFCDYGDPEASLRAIRLLHSKELGDKALVVSERTEDFQKSIVYLESRIWLNFLFVKEIWFLLKIDVTSYCIHIGVIVHYIIVFVVDLPPVVFL